MSPVVWCNAFADQRRPRPSCRLSRLTPIRASRSQLRPRFGRARIPAVLAIYKRHASPCPQKSRQYRRCNCPCWVEGTVEGNYYRKSLKTRNWERATKLAREIEEGKKPRIAITEATDAFVRDAEARGLRPASVYKYRLLFKQLKAFSEKEGLQLLSECDVETLRRFRESWINKNYSARKKLEALRTFFRFAHESSWTDSNPALLIKPTKVDDPPTLPYTQAEFRSVVEACGKYPRPEHPNERRGARLKALVLLLRYSGLRITDAVTLSKHQIEDGVLKLRTAKTGTTFGCRCRPGRSRRWTLCRLPGAITSGRGRAQKSHAWATISDRSKSSTN
jgi:integrase/recombinase XerD